MAKFEIIENEGVRLVKCLLQNETIRTESGALYYMRGRIAMESKAPSVTGLFRAIAGGETIFRPTYTGTGELYLEPSLGGFHVMNCGGRTWILENGAYWASEMGVAVDLHREKTLTAFKSGEGFFDFQTKISGEGQVVLNAQGAVEVIELVNDRLTVDGNYVLARSNSIEYSATRVTKSLFSSFTSGEGFVRIYEGSGTLLLAPIPYWRHRLFSALAATQKAAKSAG
ncbi:MAG: AIM24 family protein [Limisphaerales bacterium]